MGPSRLSASPTTRHRRIAVAGNPNSGKTTLFNALTGLRQQVANYPGVTVEKREGPMRGTDGVRLLDLPGCYSLSARAPDEQMACDLILGRRPGEEAPDGLLVVVDASNLERTLYLATQVMEMGLPVVVACNFMDLAKRRDLHVDCEVLTRALGVPVVPTVGHRGEGLDALRRALIEVESRLPAAPNDRPPPALGRAIDEVASILRDSSAFGPDNARGAARLWLIDYLNGERACRESAEAVLDRLRPDEAVALRGIAEHLAEQSPDAAALAVEARYEWIAEVVARATRCESGLARESDPYTQRLDAVLTHRVWGALILAAVMFTMFLAVFWGAEPLIRLIEGAQHLVSGVVRSAMTDGPLRSLLVDGVIAGVGAVVTFFPQILILYLLLGVLEDSGYLARAAFMTDRLMSRLGLHGKSVFPLLSSYACAIPGILATRTIEHRRDRLATILVCPLMSCSARLPVYLTVIGAVFGESLWQKAAIMFGLYAMGTLAALGSAWVLRRTILPGPPTPFIMELPAYHRPLLWPLFRNAWDRSKLFLTNAGTVIFAVCIVVWALSYFPTGPHDVVVGSASTVGQFSRQVLSSAIHEAPEPMAPDSQRLAQSYLGRMSRAIEPAIAPLGYDWRIGVGILSSFLAREVFVGTMGILFSVGEDHPQALRERLASARWPDGRKLLTPLAGASLLVFYVLACQCISTLAVVRKETGTWRWPALMFAAMTVMAYVASLAVYQIGSRLGWT